MNLLSWNCRGLGNPQAVRILNMIIKEKFPSLVFLVETKCSRSRIESVKHLTKFDYCLAVDSMGSSGGLAMMWKNNLEVQLVSFTRWHISVMIADKRHNTPWMLTGFYGHPVTSKRKLSWNLLRELKPSQGIPWLCIGDFNEILSQKEKVGGVPRPYKQMEEFREAIEFYSIESIPTKGNRYTWSNNRIGRGFTKEKLDRALANPEWKARFPNGICQVLTAMKSDHAPLSLQWEGPIPVRRYMKANFRYEAAWSLSEECPEIIKKAWSIAAVGEDASSYLRHKLANCAQALRQWNSSRKREASATIK
ncbi:uncharacterized protein LOC122289225 [Carya illinoinensis]|uniref:uncharacterized protein LOC122289225 n=1 Tax=Carya illinoinensis TaxID=32201 RepID=UPI001C71DE44|nr:uncharacterized protein LOC122289225 [Carya illinoinensis]